MEQVVLETLGYFSFFSYPPTFEELHTFLKEKTSQRRLASILQRIEEKGVITRYGEKRYTLPQYSKNATSYELRATSSEKKIEKVRFYTKLLSFFPQIKLVGLSGSVAMMNAKEDDDIDLFVITARNRLFTGRFIALVLTQILGLRRKRDSAEHFLSHESLTSPKKSAGPLESEKNATASSFEHKDKICLNLFFDENNLKTPGFKQTEYVAHEVLQMKPLVQKENIYMRFIDANKWVFDIFPNAKSKIQSSNIKSNSQFQKIVIWISDTFESLLKRFQLYFIDRHQTTEIITPTQLWFFPDDFEKKILLNKR